MNRPLDLFFSLVEGTRTRDPDTSFWSHVRDLSVIAYYETLVHLVYRHGVGEFRHPKEQVPPDMRRIFGGRGRPIAILPLFEVMNDKTRSIVYLTARVAWEVFGCPIRILRPRGPWKEVMGRKERLDADQVLDKLSNDRYLKDHSRILLLTDSDMFSDRNRWLYGYAGTVVPACAVSTFRIDGFQDRDHRAQVPTDAWRQLVRVLVHELGHTYGLNHCSYDSCIMRNVPEAGLLALQIRFCSTCRDKLTKISRRTTRPHRNS